MNPEIAEQLKAYLEAGGSFVAEQAPLLAQEIVFVGLAQSISAIVGCLLLVLTCGPAAFVLLRKFFRDCDKDQYLGVGALLTVPAGLGVVGLFCNFYWFLNVYYAPRLYVLQTISEAVNSG